MSSFPLIRQHDSMECGIACLAMVCKFFRIEYSIEYLSRICFATTEGVSLLGINETALQLGLRTISGRISINKLWEAHYPCILHWNQNHFVVLYKVKKGKTFYIADPGKGLVKYNLEEFKKHWVSTQLDGEEKGIAMFLEPTPAFYEKKTDEQPTEERSFKFLFGYIKQYRKYFGQIVLGLLVGSLLQLILPFLTQSIVDVGIKNQNIGFIWLILLGQLMLTISRTAIDFIRRWLLLHISLRINISLVSDFFIKLLKLPMSFFDTKLMGDLMQRMGDHNRVNSFLTQQTLSIVFSLFTFVVFSIVLLSYNWLVFAIFMLGSLLYGGWLALFLRRRKVLDYELFEQQAINNNKTYEFITSMQEIKLQDCEQRRRWEWEDVQADLFNVQMKSLKLQQTQEAGSIFINELKNIVITVVAATAVIHGQLTLGMMLAVQYIIGQLNSPVEQLMSFFYSVQDVRISLERINEIHRMDDENGKQGLETSVKEEDSGIDMENINFKYDPHALKTIIDNVSLTIPKGKVTAIVGASGSGKTTLIKLMLGYYPVLGGQINIGGTDVNTLNKKWWRRQCGVVMQDGVIFSESIARNIAVDDGEIDKERLRKAAEIACIHDYVMGLPLKYNTKIGRDGVGLSQGQKQRILIARAVYKNPDYIFLDEATNSLDANNERMIVEHLDEFYKGKTVVIVAHRLSTVKNADQIVVLDKGKVVEIGNHETLTAKRGAYYNLVKNQLELGN
ncbi:peptidase domain-containing ABC transporter [Prevotella nigrescens]|uniref:peptidase domain-containing ABC transporter n=1 Tax=Prevotella nigrescens TaxID=28133 RepID=UPI000218463B|nr:peptidase domain-containing ABC transporter [Prevotella nigrescens]EGQ14497.1 peptide-transporting ATPase [Prevotella nigrescens ATCC 33563]UAK28445.1 peptidase domain-containing ABC transporter [Prevotella nigrescens]WMS22450.1 peptidase domain-containing ABC transporter [Prevotella nigrescens]SUB93119.1 RTX-I toxin determinant B [Prevotella nigrescens]